MEVVFNTALIILDCTRRQGHSTAKQFYDLESNGIRIWVIVFQYRTFHGHRLRIRNNAHLNKEDKAQIDCFQL